MCKVFTKKHLWRALSVNMEARAAKLPLKSPLQEQMLNLLGSCFIVLLTCSLYLDIDICDEAQLKMSFFFLAFGFY